MIISGTGCALADFLYTKMDFSSDVFKKYMSKSPGDGGLSPGKLVFTSEFEEFAGKKFDKILKEVSNGVQADRFNVGGPSLVALIHAAQLLTGELAMVKYFGYLGNDDTGKKILKVVENLPVDISGYKMVESSTPFTDVFSDPDYDHGVGERIFVNNIGAAGKYSPKNLGADFFDADITVFGGTALVPPIHDSLSGLLKQAKSSQSFTIVNTVYDFRNESKDPQGRWPMGDGDMSYSLIDLLITDREEAFRLSGTVLIKDALQFFVDKGVKAVIITQGHDPVCLFVDKRFYQELENDSMPISDYVANQLKSGVNKGDTTGCGDNFVGGVIASLAMQMMGGCEKPDLTEAAIWGIASGGAACFYTGGTFVESRSGEKYATIAEIVEKYKNQLNSGK